MSLDLTLYNESDEEVMSLNWARNPFGLCQWAEDNADPGIDFSLYFVCNAWAYDKGDKINRPLFKSVVDAYGERVRALERGHFWFQEDRLDQTVELFTSGALSAPNGLTDAAAIRQARFVERRNGKIGIPMDLFFARSRFGYQFETDFLRLPYYQSWFAKLEHFADLLQASRYRFYCSN